jgi:SAM-dependent methyltransferase
VGEVEHERLDRVRDFWDQHARWNAKVAIYDTAEVRDPERSEEAFEEAGREDARRLSWFVHRGTRVVDVGCGMGRVMRHLAPHCESVIGIDISPEMLVRARTHLLGLDNVRLVHTSGAELPNVDDDSVGLVYSLLVLIHVDRRAAWRYLEETRRVLEPGGLAFLQFQNLLSEHGFQKFQGVVGSDYPLEFYTPEELRFLFERAGLDVLATHTSDEYVFVTAINGSAAEWCDEIAQRVQVLGFDRDGLGVQARVRSDLDRPQPFRAELGLDAGAEAVVHVDATVVLEPGREHRLAFVHSPDGAGAFTVELDGHPLATSRCTVAGDASAPDRAHVALLPPGFLWNADTLARFPGLCGGWPLAD